DGLRDARELQRCRDGRRLVRRDDVVFGNEGFETGNRDLDGIGAWLEERELEVARGIARQRPAKAFVLARQIDGRSGQAGSVLVADLPGVRAEQGPSGFDEGRPEAQAPREDTINRFLLHISPLLLRTKFFNFVTPKIRRKSPARAPAPRRSD